MGGSCKTLNQERKVVQTKLQIRRGLFLAVLGTRSFAHLCLNYADLLSGGEGYLWLILICRSKQHQFFVFFNPELQTFL